MFCKKSVFQEKVGLRIYSTEWKSGYNPIFLFRLNENLLQTLLLYNKTEIRLNTPLLKTLKPFSAISLVTDPSATDQIVYRERAVVARFLDFDKNDFSTNDCPHSIEYVVIWLWIKYLKKIKGKSVHCS